MLDRVALKPVGGDSAVGYRRDGVAVVVRRRGRQSLVVQARLTPSRKGEAYEIWLYNTRTDARSLGAQVTNRTGALTGAGSLPADYANRYRYVDVSREKIDRDQSHSGDSVLRGALP